MLAQLVRFGFVGGLATLVHVLAALSAKAAFDLPEQRANLVGFSVAVLVSYLGHMRFTFAIREGSSTQFLRFVIMSGLSLAISSGAVWLMTIELGFSFAAAMGAVAVLVPGASFLAMRFWVFSTNSSSVGLPWQGIVISAVVVLAMAVLFWGRPMSQDVAWHLFSARNWLEGAPLHDMIKEGHPPLNYYLAVPAIVIADGFGLSDINGQYAFIWVMLFASLVWCSVIIRANPGLSPLRQAILLIAIATATMVPTLNHIGQREYHLVVLMMPWLIGQMSPRPVGPKQEVATAAFAALGVCLKPQFALLPLAIALVRSIKARSLRPILSAANLTFLAVGIAYLVFLVLVHPAYFSEIFSIAALVYGA